MKRSIPTSFPALREQDCFSRRILRAELVRRIAAAQNYLWANSPRLYANCAYEGNGYRTRTFGDLDYPGQGYWNDPSTTPSGDKGKRLCAFVCPPNSGASQRLSVRGRATIGGSCTPEVVVGVYELSGAFTGTYQTAVLSSGADFSIVIKTPRDRIVQIQVWATIPDANATSDYVEISNVSARYAFANTEELFGGSSSAGWVAIADQILAPDDPVSSALLQRIIFNTNCLFGNRGLEVCQSWLARPWHNTTTYTTVGRYDTAPSDVVSEMKVRLYVRCTHGGANNNVRVNVSGLATQTSANLSVGYQTVDFTFTRTRGIGQGSGLVTFTIEARSSAASAEFGTEVMGVYIWESAVEQNLPSGTTVPTDYSPLNEAILTANDAIKMGTSAATDEQRGGIIHLIKNDLWLAKNRLKWLVGDWRHRVYKRVDYTAGGGSIYVGGRWDWTAGSETELRKTESPKNITVRGQGSLDGTDGLTGWPYGLSTGGAAGSYNAWPTAANNSYATHGRRLGRFVIVNPSGIQTHVTDALSSLKIFLRGKRARPQYMWTDSNGDGTDSEEGGYTDKGYFSVDYDPSFDLKVPIVGPPPVALTNLTGDYDPRWIGPGTVVHPATSGGTLQIAGRLQPDTAHPPSSGTAREEGELFEIELQGVLIMDAPLTQESLDAL